MYQFLMLDDVVEAHGEQIAYYGGSPGIRDAGLLESALAQAQTTFDGVYLHKDIFEMAAAYLFHLVQNHSFVDGNKRIGLETALVFLTINGQDVAVSDELLVSIVLDAAKGKASKEQIAQFFLDHAV